MQVRSQRRDVHTAQCWAYRDELLGATPCEGSVLVAHPLSLFAPPPPPIPSCLDSFPDEIPNPRSSSLMKSPRGVQRYALLDRAYVGDQADDVWAAGHPSNPPSLSLQRES